MYDDKNDSFNFRRSCGNVAVVTCRRHSLNKQENQEKRRQRVSIKKSKIYDFACRRPRLPVVMSPPFSTNSSRGMHRHCEYLRPFYRAIVKSKQTLSRNKSRYLLLVSHRSRGRSAFPALYSLNYYQSIYLHVYPLFLLFRYTSFSNSCTLDIKNSKFVLLRAYPCLHLINPTI